MNITIAADPQLVEKAKERARAQGTSLGALLRQYLETLAGVSSPEAIADEFLKLTKEHPGHSGGRPFRREEAYEGRLPGDS